MAAFGEAIFPISAPCVDARKRLLPTEEIRTHIFFKGDGDYILEVLDDNKTTCKSKRTTISFLDKCLR